jgi:hypothetical protein
MIFIVILWKPESGHSAISLGRSRRFLSTKRTSLEYRGLQKVEAKIQARKARSEPLLGAVFDARMFLQTLANPKGPTFACNTGMTCQLLVQQRVRFEGRRGIAEEADPLSGQPSA